MDGNDYGLNHAHGLNYAYGLRGRGRAGRFRGIGRYSASPELGSAALNQLNTQLMSPLAQQMLNLNTTLAKALPNAHTLQAYMHRATVGMGPHVTSDEIEHYNQFGRYPAREVDENITFHVALGYSSTTTRFFISPVRKEFVAKDLTTSQKLLDAIDDEVWLRQLNDLYPKSFSRDCVFVHVHYNRKGSIEVDGPGFEKWFRREVVHGRARSYDIELVYHDP